MMEIMETTPTSAATFALPADRITPDVFGVADDYMSERTGRFEYRAIRYRAALEVMQELGLMHNHTVYDIGAGWTELDAVLRVDGGWRGRYIPVDFGTDGTNLETWVPPRHVDFVCALEIIEHLYEPWRLVESLKVASPVVIISVPNPETCDVLGMDSDHKSIITVEALEERGFTVQRKTFYGGVYSDGKPGDSLLAVWTRRTSHLTHTEPHEPDYRRGHHAR